MGTGLGEYYPHPNSVGAILGMDLCMCITGGPRNENTDTSISGDVGEVRSKISEGILGDALTAERPTNGEGKIPSEEKGGKADGGGSTTSGDPPPHPALARHGGPSRRLHRGRPAPRPGAVARAANVLPRRPPYPRRGRRPRPRRHQVPPQGRPLQGDPRGALREGSGAGQPGHGGGGDGDRGGVQARDPRLGG